MSEPRFAPITTALLSRKGHALPSTVVPRQMPWEADLMVQSEEDESAALRLVAATPEEALSDTHEAVKIRAHRDSERPHKVRVSLSDAEFERFGLAAVKRGVTRHQILRDALNNYIERLMQEYGNSCACIGGTMNGNGRCRD
jgi:Ribbon-helix-helix protein, copG family